MYPGMHLEGSMLNMIPRDQWQMCKHCNELIEYTLPSCGTNRMQVQDTIWLDTKLPSQNASAYKLSQTCNTTMCQKHTRHGMNRHGISQMH